MCTAKISLIEIHFGEVEVGLALWFHLYIELPMRKVCQCGLALAWQLRVLGSLLGIDWLSDLSRVTLCVREGTWIQVFLILRLLLYSLSTPVVLKVWSGETWGISETLSGGLCGQNSFLNNNMKMVNIDRYSPNKQKHWKEVLNHF